MESFRTPVTLTGQWVRLVPLVAEHATALQAAARDPEVRRYLLHSPGESLEEMRSLIALRLERQKLGVELPFATILTADDRPIGMTAYLHIDRTNRSVEVGGTWLDSAFWRTPVNTESKYLLFRHAFETQKVHRVSLQTDILNERSQRAIERLGAVREAVFREDKIRPDGSFRTSVVYGILASEWPRVRVGLEAALARDWRAPGRPGPVSRPVGAGGVDSGER
jgi:RimJ/RimL family protein N-acetyltransferase